MMATSLPDFPPFDTESELTSLGIHWKKWIFETRKSVRGTRHQR